MDLNLYFIAVLILGAFAITDLMVGVSNDAVNFLNSSIGSRVAPRHIIMIIASIGILVGVLFSGGMMEVARKGIFHPQYFTMPELITLFMAVMLADVIILDLFNTFGLPTSTTVSIVFELLGAALGLSIIKIIASDQSLLDLGQYINSAKAMLIIGGILLSVIIAFVCGAIVQFISRLIFTFDYKPRLKVFGGLWGGLAIACILMFLLIKGAKSASFIPPQMADWIKKNPEELFVYIFVTGAVFFQILVSLFKVNILKPVVLIGTFALALAFAANDLVNFIGVPLAGLHAFQAAAIAPDPLTVPMSSLASKVPSSNFLLLLAGVIMVVTLWFSKKARTVTETEISLASHDEENEKFESTALSRVTVRMTSDVFDVISVVIPRSLKRFTRRRFDKASISEEHEVGERISFDLLRASVNLMVASIVVSFATILKLPLSTTYVTFMVAMGTSFADQAWGRETAVYRVTGVITVIGGWFMTAILATFTAACFVVIMHFFGVAGFVAVVCLAVFSIYRTHHAHKDKTEAVKEEEIYNLKKITDAAASKSATFGHTAYFLGQMRVGISGTLEGLFEENLSKLRVYKKTPKKISRWSTIIAANIFKSMRLLQVSGVDADFEYPKTIGCLESLAESYRSLVKSSYSHVSHHHTGLRSAQVRELREAHAVLDSILQETELTLNNNARGDIKEVRELAGKLEDLLDTFHQKQVERIVDRSSKTRLSILYYTLMGDMRVISLRCVRLLEIFKSI